jgi:hypothetical protein
VVENDVTCNCTGSGKRAVLTVRRPVHTRTLLLFIKARVNDGFQKKQFFCYLVKMPKRVYSEY